MIPLARCVVLALHYRVVTVGELELYYIALICGCFGGPESEAF
jgi:hypothetical protein